MTKTMNMNQKAHFGKAKKNSPPLNGRSALFSSDWTGTVGTKRQTYHIHVDLIAKLRGLHLLGTTEDFRSGQLRTRTIL